MSSSRSLTPACPFNPGTQYCDDQSVMYFRAETLDLPRFWGTLKADIPKILKLFGSSTGGIDLATHPQLSRRYVLGSDDETAVRELFGNELVAFFENQQNICVQGCDQQLVFFLNKKRIKPNEVEQFMEQGFDVFARFRRPENA